MAFNVSAITKYTDEVSQNLIKKSVMAGKTIDLISVMPGIKYKQTLNILTNTISVQDATCGFTSNGSVAISQREIEVVGLEIKESLCPKTLESYFLGMKMKPGSARELPEQQIIADSYVEKVKEYNEMSLWQGGTHSSYTKFDGFVQLLAGEVTRVTATSSTTFTASTIIGAVDLFVNSIPEDIIERGDLHLFMSYANFLLYTNALRTANLYQMNVGDNANYIINIPGTDIKVVATKGLSGTGWMVLTYAENLVMGTDLMNEDEKFDIWYSQDNDEVRVNIQWKIGAQVQFPEHCVCNF